MTVAPGYHQPIATWFRYCLLNTAVFNLFGAISFVPPVYYSTADTLGFPKDAPPFALWVIASWVLIFGVAYAWLAIKSKPENLFIAVAAACKITIAIFFFIFWLIGDFPSVSLLVGSADFLFGIAFIFWLYQSHQAAK